jgi:hypothetical protein
MAAAEILFTLVTSAARFLHPAFATEVVETRRFVPDPINAALAHVV